MQMVVVAVKGSIRRRVQKVVKIVSVLEILYSEMSPFSGYIKKRIMMFDRFSTWL